MDVCKGCRCLPHKPVCSKICKKFKWAVQVDAHCWEIEDNNRLHEWFARAKEGGKNRRK